MSRHTFGQAYRLEVMLAISRAEDGLGACSIGPIRGAVELTRRGAVFWPVPAYCRAGRGEGPAITCLAGRLGRPGRPAGPGCRAGLLGGQRPGAVAAGQALAEQVTQV